MEDYADEEEDSQVNSWLEVTAEIPQETLSQFYTVYHDPMRASTLPPYPSRDTCVYESE